MSYTIRLRTRELDKAIQLKGITSDNALANTMGVARSTVIRARRGELSPGPAFIGGALTAFPELTFEDLFEVTEADSPADVA